MRKGADLWRVGCYGKPGAKCAECSVIGRPCSWRQVKGRKRGRDEELAYREGREEVMAEMMTAFRRMYESMPSWGESRSAKRIGVSIEGR